MKEYLPFLALCLLCGNANGQFPPMELRKSTLAPALSLDSLMNFHPVYAEWTTEDLQILKNLEEPAIEMHVFPRWDSLPNNEKREFIHNLERWILIEKAKMLPKTKL